MVRAACIDNNGLKKGEWSKEEDQKLSAYVLRYGHWNWRLVPKYAGLNRCGKSCRLRWMNYLKPGLKRGNFTKEEGELIKRLHDELGNKWSAIAAKLPGRTDNEIKNYWHTHFEKLNHRKSGQQQQQTKVPKGISSEINATHWKNPTNSSEMVHTCLKQAVSDVVCPDEYILDSSSGSNNWVPESATNWDLGSVMEKDLGFEMRFEPSDSLGFSYGGSDDGASSLSGSFPGFQESFVVDTSYIQEFDLSLFDDCGSYYSQILGFENDHVVKLF